MSSLGKPPEELASLQPFLQKADEIEAKEKVVAYYLRYYAAKLGIGCVSNHKGSQVFLGKIIDSLEQIKKELRNSELLNNDTAAYAHVENIALKIFLVADNEDRAGQASKKTAKMFYTASIFLEALKVFGELEPEIAEKLKYARWKATTILRASKEGTPSATETFGTNPTDIEQNINNRSWVPPHETTIQKDINMRSTKNLPPFHHSTTNDDFSTLSSSNLSPRSGSLPFPRNTTTTATTSTSLQTNVGPSKSTISNMVDHTTISRSSMTMPLPQPAAALSTTEYTTMYKYNPKDIDQATKLCKHTLSALQYQDVSIAITNLKKALDILTSLEPSS